MVATICQPRSVCFKQAALTVYYSVYAYISRAKTYPRSKRFSLLCFESVMGPCFFLPFFEGPRIHFFNIFFLCFSSGLCSVAKYTPSLIIYNSSCNIDFRYRRKAVKWFSLKRAHDQVEGIRVNSF